jgi:hypothetical protein
MAARIADDDQGHEGRTDEHGQANPGGGCDQQIDVPRRIAACDHDRQQDEQPEDLPEAAFY